MGIAKKLGLILMMVTVVALSLPAHIILAQGTTVEVNSGKTITLDVGQSITASGTSGMPVEVKGLPGLGAPANGLAAFTFSFRWNKNVIRVDSAFAATAAGWTAILPGTPDNVNGRVNVTGFTTTYSTNNIILLYLGITAVGKAGDSTSINVTITSLGDKDGNPIAATTVNAPVRISGLELVSIALAPTDSSIALGLTQQFTAIGTYNNKSIANITDVVTWVSSNKAIATIQTIGEANPGLATCLAVGTTTITATLSTIYGTTTLTVTKAEAEMITPISEKKEVAPAPTSEGKKVTPVPTSEEEKLATTIPSGEKKAPTAPEPAPPVRPKLINWWLVGVIIAGVVLLGLLSYFLARRRG